MGLRCSRLLKTDALPLNYPFSLQPSWWEIAGFSSRRDLDNWSEWRVTSVCLIMQALKPGARGPLGELGPLIWGLAAGGHRGCIVRVGLARQSRWAGHGRSHPSPGAHCRRCFVLHPRAAPAWQGALAGWSPSSCTTPAGALPCYSAFHGSLAPERQWGLAPGLLTPVLPLLSCVALGK